MFSKEITEIISTTDSCIHSTNFVDPITQACTNNVEGSWKHVKRHLSAVNGSSAELLSGYLVEYLWRKRYIEKTDQLPLRSYYPTSLGSTLKIAKISQMYNFFPIL